MPPPYPPPTGCRRVYIPFHGYLDADDDHRARVDRFFRVPMLVLALLVLPVLGIEYVQSREDWDYLGQEILEHFVMRVTVIAALVFIWLAFLIEFVVKIAIAPSRVQYAVRNWLDIVIILLPMLRPLRGARALRVVRLGQVSRVMTLRGVAMKMVRVIIGMIIGMEAVRRFQERFRAKRNEPAPPDYTQWSRAALLAEIRRLTDENAALKEGRERGRVTPAPPRDIAGAAAEPAATRTARETGPRDG